jgi:glycosyltransferase involved in cell wall biosynthesis
MKKTKTVAFLLRAVYCHDGVASHVETLIRALRLCGWQIVIISGHVYFDELSKSRYQRIKDDVVEWLELPALNFRKPSLKYLLQIASFARRHKATAFHSHGLSGLPLAALLFPLSGIRAVATYHPSIQGHDPSKLLEQASMAQQAWKYRLLFMATFPKVLIAESREILDWLSNDVRVISSKVRHIPLGIDVSAFRPPTDDERKFARSSIPDIQSEIVFLLAGRLSWNKGHDILINAARQVADAGYEGKFKVVFSGSGSESNEIQEMARRVEGDRKLFVFLGFIEDLRQAYWASDVFVLPSRSEGFALAVAEAMCCGLVPIRTPAGGARDQIIDGETGCLIAFDSAEDCANKMIILMQDADLRNKLAVQANRHAMQLFSMQRMAEKTIECYLEC